MFKSYQSKPITRVAHRIEEADVFTAIDEYTSVILIGDEAVEFKHYEPVQAGDYVVRLTVADTYHNSAAIFAERNIVE